MSDLSRRAVVAGTLTVIAGSEAVAALAEQEKNKAAYERSAESKEGKSDAPGPGIDNEVGYHEFPEPITALCALPGGHNVCVACGSKLYIIKIL